jgi:hypothetical protein
MRQVKLAWRRDKRVQRIRRERLAAISHRQDQLDRVGVAGSESAPHHREDRREARAAELAPRELLNGCGPHPTYGRRD